jgi:hypothetical protein
LLLVVRHRQDHLEVWVFSGRAKHRPVDEAHGFVFIERRGNGDAVLVAGDGVPHQDLAVPREEDEEETMATSKGYGAVVVVAVTLQGEAPGRDAIGGLQGRTEGTTSVLVEEAEEGRIAAVPEAEAAKEAGVGDEAAPALADGGGPREGRRLRGEAEEDLAEEVVVIQGPDGRRAGVAAAAAHLALDLARSCGQLMGSEVKCVGPKKTRQ